MNDTEIGSNRSRRRFLACAIGGVLLLVFSFPIFLLFWSAAGAIGGLAIIGLFVVVQLPLFIVLQRMGWLPLDRSNERPDQEATSASGKDF